VDPPPHRSLHQAAPHTPLPRTAASALRPCPLPRPSGVHPPPPLFSVVSSVVVTRVLPVLYLIAFLQLALLHGEVEAVPGAGTHAVDTGRETVSSGQIEASASCVYSVMSMLPLVVPARLVPAGDEVGRADRVGPAEDLLTLVVRHTQLLTALQILVVQRPALLPHTRRRGGGVESVRRT
jgi:hypothetical protein